MQATKPSPKFKLNAITRPTHAKTEAQGSSRRNLLRVNQGLHNDFDNFGSPKSKGFANSKAPIQCKLSSMVNLSTSERTHSTIRIPDYWQVAKLSNTPVNQQIQPHDIPLLQLKPNHSTIFVVKSPITDISQLRILSINRHDLLYKGEDIYLHRTNLLAQIRFKLQIPQSYKYLFIFNQQPIQFFQEIPMDCNLIFISNTTQIDFWSVILSSHMQPNTQVRVNLVLNAILKLNTVEELKHFLLDRESFHNQLMVQEFQNQNFDPFLTNVKPLYEKTKVFYRQKHTTEQEQRDYLESNRLEEQVLGTHNNDSNNMKDSEILKRNLEEDQDFTILRYHPKPETIQKILDKNELNGFARSKHRQSEHNNQAFQINRKSRRLPYNKNCKVLEQKYKYTNQADSIARNHPTMTSCNIPKIMAETGFDRLEIHEVYSRYKALLSYECMRSSNHQKGIIPKGISFKSFNAGLDELSMAPQGVVDQLFKFFADQDSLNFEGFLKAINLIRAKRNDNKIELILKLIDENENGLLSYEEITNRCSLMMDSILKKEDGELSIDNMVDYITRSIFDAVKVPYDEEIPIDMIRKLIESKSQEAKVLIMMCCGDVNYID